MTESKKYDKIMTESKKYDKIMEIMKMMRKESYLTTEINEFLKPFKNEFIMVIFKHSEKMRKLLTSHTPTSEQVTEDYIKKELNKFNNIFIKGKENFKKEIDKLNKIVINDPKNIEFAINSQNGGEPPPECILIGCVAIILALFYNYGLDELLPGVITTMTGMTGGGKLKRRKQKKSKRRKSKRRKSKRRKSKRRKK